MDVAESVTTDGRVKDRLGGWQDSETRKQIYQHRQTDELRTEPGRVRRELWVQPGMRVLADNRALSDVPPNPEFAGAAFADVRRACVARARRVGVLVFNAFEYGSTRHGTPR